MVLMKDVMMVVTMVLMKVVMMVVTLVLGFLLDDE